MNNPDTITADGSLAATTITTGGTFTTAITTTTVAAATAATRKSVGAIGTKPIQRHRHHHHHHHRNSLKSQPTSRAQFNDDDDDEEDNDDDNSLLHLQYNSSTASSILPFPALAISGGSSAQNDNAYITEIARRSVARAALHLGIEGMEGMALDTLGSVLLGYLEMVRRFCFLCLDPFNFR